MAKSVTRKQAQRHLAIGTTVVLLGVGMARRSHGEDLAEFKVLYGMEDDARNGVLSPRLSRQEESSSAQTIKIAGIYNAISGAAPAAVAAQNGDQPKAAGLQAPSGRTTYRAKAGATPPPPAPSPDAYESDNTLSTAKRIANGQTQRRTIHAARNTDWAKFRVAAGGARNVRIETAGPGGDTQLWLYKSDGTLLAYNDNSGIGNFSRIRRSTLPRGNYYIKIREYGNNGTIQNYTLRTSWTPQ